ncbi:MULTISPECIES: glycerate kinase [unclassified Brenneria]|uniref:glycerate kinase family protein n=1 Tax=unclassified Brenneria TaxID=2634434 RepID=UPI0029C33362|nr:MULTISPECIES: glycerate kinase [unclassified Brenneria]MDX5628791.1 glycerate kinase [Brenneria sp. L3-3Z]MDX5695930.1 glycerate kinase [Brenneria sp. L4-2C]MEE3661220.1 glycerate kinase [Brenneria sp. g21c3]
MKKETFVLAPDSFKESMTAKEVCNAMEKGLRKVFPDANYIHVPMADGGEGTTQSLIDATQGSLYALTVTGPLGKPVEASYGIMGDGEIAVIEMASASGIHFVDRDTKNPLATTTYGTGELIRACLDRGIKKIILGIGGSATNDGGAGMAQALGARFYDAAGEPLPCGGGALGRLHRIDVSGLDSRLAQVDIQVACDVTNPLCGEQGASAIFGPQKGATPDMVAQLDANLAHYAAAIRSQLHKDVADIPGAGAAGGLGAGLMAFTRCSLRKGIDIVVEFSGLRDKLAGADFCFTGEGRIDYQTKFGKTPYGVARTAKAQGVPVIAVSGCIGDGVDTLYDEGIDVIFGIIPHIDSIDALLKDGAVNMARACENIGRLLKTAAYK